MSLQDIPVTNTNKKARVMFDKGLEITLVSSIFAKKKNLPFEEASYTLAGIGSNPTTYNNGRIYNIPLLDSNQEIIFVKAFSVDSILSEKIRQEEVILNKEEFPHLSKEVLQEAAKPLARKYLDILINDNNFDPNLHIFELYIVIQTRIYKYTALLHNPDNQIQIHT